MLTFMSRREGEEGSEPLTSVKLLVWCAMLMGLLLCALGTTGLCGVLGLVLCDPELASARLGTEGGAGSGFLLSAGEDVAPVMPGRGCLRGEMRWSSLLCSRGECSCGLLLRSDSLSLPSLAMLPLLIARGLFAALPNEGRRAGSDLLCRIVTFFTQSDLGCKICC